MFHQSFVSLLDRLMPRILVVVHPIVSLYTIKIRNNFSPCNKINAQVMASIIDFVVAQYGLFTLNSSFCIGKGLT